MDAAPPAIRILPDQAVLRRQARAAHELTQKGVENAAPAERFETNRLDSFMYDVKGVYVAEIDGQERAVDFSCDVNSNGVAVFTMAQQPEEWSGLIRTSQKKAAARSRSTTFRIEPSFRDDPRNEMRARRDAH